jgi:MSHA biogenesis protein MshP
MCRKRQNGFSIVAAIFLIVVLATLGAFAVTVSGLNQGSSALDLQGARAYQAARAGIEWGAYQVLQNGPGAFATACQAASYAAPTSQSLSGLGGTLSPFTVTVTCGSSSNPEGGATVWIYQIVSTATAGGGAFQVERQLQAMIGQ